MEGEYDNCIRFKSILENANDLVMVIQDDAIEFVNRKPLADFGYSMQDVIDKSIFNFIHADDRDKASEIQIRKALSKGLPDDLIFRIVCKNGSLAFLKIFSIRTEWKGRPAHLVCAINMTDRKLNEITLQQSESLLYVALNNFPDPTFVIDINGRMYLWNKAMETISGVNSSDIAGKHDFESAVPYSG